MSMIAHAYKLSKHEAEAERLQVIFNSILKHLIEAKEYLFVLFLNRDIFSFGSTSNRNGFPF